MFHQFLQEEFMFVIFVIKSLLYLSLAFLTRLVSIPPILHNDNLIFDDIERANLFNIYFSKQSEIDDSNSNIPNLSHVANQISEVPY
jgi:hypothetical protein